MIDREKQVRSALQRLVAAADSPDLFDEAVERVQLLNIEPSEIGYATPPDPKPCLYANGHCPHMTRDGDQRSVVCCLCKEVVMVAHTGYHAVSAEE